MKKKTAFYALSLSVSLALGLNVGSGIASANDQPSSQKGEKEVVVVYKNMKGKEAAIENSHDVEHQFKSIPAVSVTADKQDVRQLESNPNIAYVEENVPFQLADSSFQTLSTKRAVSSNEKTWDMQAINASKAWENGVTGKGVKIAVIDTGIAPHSDLNIAGGVSTVDYTSSYKDDNGHGTHVAGIIGAKRNGIGIAGVAPDAQIYAVKALDKNGNGNLQDIAEALDWAIANKMDIINMSFGTSTDSKILHDLVDKAYKSGILLVAAGGNNGNSSGTGDTVEYPAKYNSVVAVSSLNSNKNRSVFSATGPEIEVSAPGENIVSTYLNGEYAVGSGTSMAAPHVAGMLALLKQMHPNELNSQLRAEAEKEAMDLGKKGKDDWYGYGMVFYHPLNVSSKSASETVQAKLKIAQQAVESAEKNRTKKYVDAAQQAINSLDNGADKTQLQKRLDAVKKSLSDQAQKLVSYVEHHRSHANVEKALQAISNLPAGAEKNNLLTRINKVQYLINLQQAQKYVNLTQKYKKKSYKSVAQSYIEHFAKLDFY
ncbi:S8 family peptidase [Bacillus smithii]|uniref:S8 family peptidase n=1 Tax=Bacillus smithii TaxID=1479 RepID=UPI0022DFFC58|nr:S8 family peptidase [Bacillus smithii]